MNNPILTVLVPVYNTEAYLDKCLGSLVVSQELMNLLEVLVVIDGSKDNSIEIARKYETKYPKTFRVIDKENGGHGSCCNLGIAEAKGKYIHFLDSDDWFDDNFSCYLLRLKNEKADVVFTKRIDENKYEMISNVHFFSDIAYDHSFSLESLQNKKFVFTIHEVSYAVCYLREYNVLFRERISHDDAILTVAGFLGVKSIAFYDMVLYHYLIGRPGQSMEPIILMRHFKDRCYATKDCILLYENSRDKNNEISNEFVLRSIGWNLDRLYTDAWKQPKDSKKENILFLNKLFKDSIKKYSIKKNIMIVIALYFPFSLGNFLIQNVILRR